MAGAYVVIRYGARSGLSYWRRMTVWTKCLRLGRGEKYHGYGRMVQRAGAVTWAVRRILGRLLGRRGPEASTPSGEALGAGDDDAYTLYEGSTLRLHNLSAEPLDNLRAELGLLPGAFRIRIARRQDSSEDASSLVKRRYAWRGYQLSSAKATDPHLSTFIAYNNGELVGTVSLRLGSSKGLAADALYKAEVDALRFRDLRVCEFTRLALDVNAGSKPVLAGLFHTAYIFAYRVSGYDYTVIEVNPRHVSFYKRALGFEVIGPERLSRRVNAPAVLLCVSFHTVAEWVEKYAGKPELAKTTRLLYPHFFSAKDAAGILGRLQAFSVSGGDAAA